MNKNKWNYIRDDTDFILKDNFRQFLSIQKL